MSPERSLKFKIASEESEFEQIFHLNYDTFVEEIPQHPPNAERRLIDRFHQENTYIIALQNEKVVAMIAARDNRPFSLDEKLGSIDPYIPAGRNVFEARLLSIAPEYRNGTVFQGLIKSLVEYGKGKGYNLAVISATTRQLRLYRHLGFVPFGPLVGSHDVQFQPMYLTLESFVGKAPTFLNVPARADREVVPHYFLTGPVSIRPEVREAMGELPISHRSDQYKDLFISTRRMLCELVQARHVQLFLGSGTLANDVIAAQLSLIPGPGLILSSGEFGDRLIDHARRAGLAFQTLEIEWGDVFSRQAVQEALKYHGDTRWLWTVGCETSTGILNDIDELREVCGERDISLCLDCISSIGTVPVDLRGILFASCVSGKGLGAFPGISMVFYHHGVSPQPARLPRYLDLGFYAAQAGIPFTHSSNLLAALHAALRHHRTDQPYATLQDLSRWLRPRVRELGFPILAPDDHASPAVVTLVLPETINSGRVGNALRRKGLIVGYQSEYLLRRNWIQICIMGTCSRGSLSLLLDELQQETKEQTPVPTQAG